MEALWAHQYQNVVNVELLEADAGLARLPRPGRRHARALRTGATACPDALDLLKKLAADPHPRVRLEAVRAASFFTGRRGGRGRP